MRKTSYAVDLLDGAYRRISESAMRLKEDRARLSEVRQPLLRIIKAVCPEPIKRAWDDRGAYSIDCYADGEYCHPTVRFNLSNIDSFKDARLVKVLEYLSEVDGLKRTRTQDWPQSVNRVFTFEFEKFNVSVDAYVKEDSPTCRKVVVSTELIKQDKYEIVCD